MEGHNVWAIVNGKEAKPTKTLVIVQDWKTRELKSKILLCMLVKDLVIPQIRDITTSSGTWLALKGLYEIRNSNRIFFFKRKLLSIKMEVNESISEFLSRDKELGIS